MLQNKPAEEEGKNPININEPINPYMLCNDTYFLMKTLLDILKVGNEHFEKDQKLSDINPNDIDSVVLFMSDFFTWIDAIYSRITLASRNQHILVRYLQESKKAMESAMEYQTSESSLKKRKLEKDTEQDSNIEMVD